MKISDRYKIMVQWFFWFFSGLSENIDKFMPDQLSALPQLPPEIRINNLTITEMWFLFISQTGLLYPIPKQYKRINNVYSIN